jgi:O-antigen ligase
VSTSLASRTVGSGASASRLHIHPLDWTVILVAFLAFPLALLGEVDSVSLGSLGWVTILGVGLLAGLVVPLSYHILRSMALWIAFLALGVTSLLFTTDFAEGVQILAQYSVVGVAYVSGWRALDADSRLLGRLRGFSLWLIPAGLIVFVKSMLDGRFAFGWLVGDAARPMVMMLSLLFLLATLDRPRRFTAWVWAGTFLIAIASGGRMGIAVLALMLALTPALRLSGKTRVAIAVGGIVMLSLLIQFEAVQERLFVGRQEGELADIVSLEGNFNTAGRAENWPRIAEACSDKEAFGYGAGSSALLTLEATAGLTEHPHNDYLRTYCEFGFVGSALFWGFFALAGIRGWRLFRDRRASSLESQIGAVSGLAVLALLLFALTDNVVTYTATFMVAAGVIWGMSDRTYNDVIARKGWKSTPLSAETALGP